MVLVPDTKKQRGTELALIGQFWVCVVANDRPAVDPKSSRLMKITGAHLQACKNRAIILDLECRKYQVSNTGCTEYIMLSTIYIVLAHDITLSRLACTEF